MNIIKKTIVKFFSFILAILIAILFGICLIFILPVDYIKYKKSPYCKNTKQKYTFLAAMGINFKMYNEITENNLPIRFIKNPTAKSIEHGWFVFEKTLIIANAFAFEYNSNSDQWNFVSEDGDEECPKRILLTIDEYISLEIEEINKALDGEICDNAIILICSDNVENEEKAESEDRFLIYKDNWVEKLKSFCESGERR